MRARLPLRADNDPEYRRFKALLKVNVVKCWKPSCTNRATSPDHDPPLSWHTHIRGSGCCTLRPSCLPCQHRQGGSIIEARRTSGYTW